MWRGRGADRADGDRGSPGAAPAASSVGFRAAIGALDLVAGAQILVGLAAVVRDPARLLQVGERYPGWVFLLIAVVNGLVGAFLSLGGARDRGTKLLGTLFLLTSSLYSYSPLAALAGSEAGPLAAVAGVLSALFPFAYAPALGWALLAHLPSLEGRPPGERLRRAMLNLSIAFGTLCFLLRAADLPGVRDGLGSASWGEAWLSVTRSGFEFVVLGILAAPQLGFVWFRARRASASELERIKLLLLALILGFGPITLLVAGEVLFPAFASFMARPLPSALAGLVVFPCLAALPLVTAYLVQVRRVLGARVVVRRTVQYALAKTTLAVLVALPFSALLFFVYRQRQQTLLDLVSGPPFLALLGLTSLAAVAFVAQRPLARFIDRRFFREHHDTHQILANLLEALSWVDNQEELAALIRRDTDRALHLDRVDLLLYDASARRLRSTDGVHTVQLSPELEERLNEAREIDVSSTQSPPATRHDHSASADTNMRQAAAGWSLLVPMRTAAGRVLGALAVGAKRSELAFSREDLRLLSAVATSGALALDNLTVRRAGPSPGETALPSAAALRDSAAAFECPSCGRVLAEASPTCRLCECALVPAQLPLVLADKFEVTRRLGQGGTGVVYLARDLHLERPVAIKALQEVSAGRAQTLLREARAMASLSDPHLAMIYGAEEWRGRPFLVLEFLPGRDLKSRLKGGPLDVGVALRVARSIGEALAHVHAAGLLHRDVKPSNIGFTADEEPKLLDFGLAQLLGSAAVFSPASLHATVADLETTSGSDDPSIRSMATLEGRLVGTPAYLSPEALRGEPPTPALDLWGLSVVLLESLLGRNPFAAPTLSATFLKILTLDLAPIVSQARLAPPLVELIESSLSRDRALRPQTARDFVSQVSARML